MPIPASPVPNKRIVNGSGTGCGGVGVGVNPGIAGNHGGAPIVAGAGGAVAPATPVKLYFDLATSEAPSVS